MNYDPKTGEERTEGFGTTSIEVRQTAAIAVAEQAKAEVQARYIMALQRPRDIDAVRTAVLKDCRRPGFAATARYSVPRAGRSIVGPSIRFAESIMRSMGNIDSRHMVTHDDAEQRIIRVQVTDLEANLTFADDLVISKTIERNALRAGQTPISSRTNSSGVTTYLVAATEDDVRNKQASAISKSLRGLALRLLPADILEEAMAQVVATTRDADAKDPDAARKRLVDAFADLSVTPADLREYLGVECGKASPADIVELRGVYTAIREGSTTWRDALAGKVVQAPAEKVETAKDKLKATVAKTGPREPGQEG
jgi:hypothetical protein